MHLVFRCDFATVDRVSE